MVTKLKKMYYGALLVLLVVSGLSKATIVERTTVSSETENFIRSILARLAIDAQVTEIHQFNSDDIENYGTANVVVIKNWERPSFTQKLKNLFSNPPLPTFTIILYEPWFNALTPEEKTFLIGHEAMHIILGHVEGPVLDKNNLDDMALSRRNENEADRQAVLRLNCIAGGLAFLKRLEAVHTDTPRAAHDSPQHRSALLKTLLGSAEPMAIS